MEKYKQPKMVNWYNPVQLYATALKAVVSGTFASYADNREVQAALDKSRDFYTLKEKEESDAGYGQREIWFDYISDTGDGFDPTYTVADLVAQPLDVANDPNFLKLPNATNGQLSAGEMLILGGDQVYPTPTKEEYDARFKVPFRAASTKHHNEGNHPKMFAIPGNHDWYDGLSNFIKLFCQKRWIGNWRTEQRRSYFAIKLSHNYWIWAVDVQLNSDIDQPQKDYFKEIGNKMDEGDKVILCTSEPAWVYNKMRKEDETYKRLKYFEQVFITDDDYDYRCGKRFELIATITGDLHHYSRYEEFKEITNADGKKQYLNHLITAGGGGAFLHPTHNLPQALTELNKVNDPVLDRTQIEGKDPKRKAVFPSIADSKKLSWGIFKFSQKNKAFVVTMAVIQLGLAWVLQSTAQHNYDHGFMHLLANADGFGAVINVIIHNLYLNPSVLFICFVVVGGMAYFTDVYSGKWYRILGAIHGLGQLTVMFLGIWFFSRLNLNVLQITNKLLYAVLYAGETFVAAIVGSFIMGIYLWTCNRVFGIHDNESFSSLAHTGFKNFLRMHIDKEGNLTIYPVGITEVATNWQASGEGEKMTFHTNKPAKYHLIEEPITIKKDNRYETTL